MKIKLFFILIISILFASCKEKTREYKGLAYLDYKESDFRQYSLTKSKGERIKIPPVSDYKVPIPMAKLLDTCFIVSLESCPDNLIGRIDEIKVVDEYIFVLDSRKSKGVFMFDLNGKYLRRIGETGGGPGEYPFPGDLAINEKDEEIFIFNGNLRKIFKYNFEGEFLGETQLNFGGYSINLTKDGHIIVFSQGYSNDHLGEIKNKAFYVIDNKGNIVSYGTNLSNDFKNVHITIANKISAKNKNISFSNKFSDTIYKIVDNQVYTDYVLDFGENALDRSSTKLMSTNTFLKTIQDDNLIPNYRGIHYQTPHYLYFSFFYGRTIINGYYNKNTRSLFASNIIDLKNINCLYSFTPQASHGNYFISSIDAFNLVESRKNILKDNQLKENNQQMLKILDQLNVKETDNPVLVFYKLKDTVY